MLAVVAGTCCGRKLDGAAAVEVVVAVEAVANDCCSLEARNVAAVGAYTSFVDAADSEGVDAFVACNYWQPLSEASSGGDNYSDYWQPQRG